MKKEILKNNASSGYEQTQVYTLVSVESDLKVCWIINSILGINLSLSEDVRLNLSKSTNSFKRFQYITEDESEKYSLIVNRNQGNLLVPELKKIDYLFIIQTQNKLFSAGDKIPKIKEHQDINAFIGIHHNSIRSFSRLLMIL